MPRRSIELDVSELTQAIGMLMRRMRAASASYELSHTESAVMGRLAREGSRTTAELARAEGVKPQSMGATVAALEQMGIVARKPHPTDGRQMMIELTPEGAATLRSAKMAKRTWLAEAIGHLDKQDQATLFAAGEIIQRLAEL